MVKRYDFLVIGSGVAGMSYALKVANAGKGRVAMVCKTTLAEANTAKAQGGIASVTNLKVDDFDKHIEDTMIAGDHLSDRKAVEQVVRNAPSQIAELVRWGVNFDRTDSGEFDLHREGGHSEFRILHHADDTGAEIQRGLMEAVRRNPNIDVLENHFAVEIITQHHLGVEVTRRTPDIECFGAYILNPETNKIDTYLSRVTLMATGGIGSIYATTTNPNIATGDGIAMVYRAKGTVQDMEFVQFHPTALFHPGETHPAYLITEAMRGYGGILRLPNGEEFMHKYDERLSLAPRDIVARAIDKEMKIHGLDHVCLDVTHKDPEETKHHFPNIYAKCLSIGIDITKQYIPVAPCAHYMCGGIKVDLNACSSIRRLYAVGECARGCAAETRVLTDALAAGKLPLRVTHNDTKVNNVLLDRNTEKAVCVIDLDTVMPGLLAYDFGDAIRVGACSAAEDEQNLDLIHLEMPKYRAFARGFLSQLKGMLSRDELLSLEAGARIMTLENGLRFLADHLKGDVYFKIHRPGQNLDRARAQFALFRDMEKHSEEMKAILLELYEG